MLSTARGFAPALIAIMLAVSVIAGCGGGGETDTTAADTAAASPPRGSSTATEPSPTPAQRGQAPKPSPSRPGPSRPREPKHSAATKPLPPPPTTRSPLPNQGTKAPAPGVPTPKGADNSIQGYGLESESADRLQGAAVAKAYLDAQAAGRWGEACAYLSAKIRARLEALAKEAKGSSAQGCPQTMEAFLASAPKDALRTVADIEAISMRVQGDRAFLIYRDGEGSTAELVMAREGGEWKVGALVGNALAVGG